MNFVFNITSYQLISKYRIVFSDFNTFYRLFVKYYFKLLQLIQLINKKRKHGHFVFYISLLEIYEFIDYD